MHFAFTIVSILSFCWLLFHAFTDIASVLAGEISWPEKCVGVVAVISFAIRYYGQHASSDIARILGWLSQIARTGRILFWKLSKILGRYFGSSEDILRRNTRRIDNGAICGPIETDFVKSNQGLLPAPLAVLATIAMSLVLFGYYLCVILTVAPAPKIETTETKPDFSTARKNDRQELPASFADRFVVPNEIPGTGGH